MHDLATFSLDDMIGCGAMVRGLEEGARGMEDTTKQVVRALYDNLASPATGERCCALVRFFVTQRLDALSEERRTFALRAAAGHTLAPDTTCLTLLATAGDEPDWNDPMRSAGHVAIPLPSKEALARMPMIARLCAQLGIEASWVLRPEPSAELAERTYDVFHVENAAESPYVPAKASFVDRHGIRSVVGCGGVLPSGQMFVVLLFSKVHVAKANAEFFRPLALAIKLAILRGASEGAAQGDGIHEGENAVLRSRAATLEALLGEHERAAANRAVRMAQLVMDLSARDEEMAQKLAAEREKNETLERLRVAVHELSTPILEVWDGVLALPLIGVVDSKRAAQVMETLLDAVVKMRGKYVILDVTGVDVLDTATADHLLKIVRAVELLGARCVLTGVRPSVAQTLVELGVSFGSLVTLRNLKHGLDRCLRWKDTNTKAKANASTARESG